MSNLTDTILGTLFFGGMFYISEKIGEERAYKNIADKALRDEVADLRRKLNELNRQNSMKRA